MPDYQQKRMRVEYLDFFQQIHEISLKSMENTRQPFNLRLKAQFQFGPEQVEKKLIAL